MRDLLRSLWDEPAVADPPGRRRRDVVLAAALVPTAIVEAALRDDITWRIVALVLTLALIPTLLWRRTHPLAMVLLTFGSTAVVDAARLASGHGTNGLYTAGFVILVAYALFRWGSGRDIAIGMTLMTGVAIMSIVGDYTGLGDAIGGVTFFVALMAIGVVVRQRIGARQREHEQVKLLERERLARDLHDTVAHHVSAIAIRAQAGLAVAATDPEGAADALRVIEAEASRTLTEMRSMVRVLRHDEAALAPVPLVSDLMRLRDDGPPRIEVDVQGAVDRLSPSVSTAVFRIAQESITNARRHARHATHVRVDVTVDDASVTLHVADDGEPVRHTATTGYGLVGMSERASLLGGTCAATPTDRGWQVHAVLPFDGARS